MRGRLWFLTIALAIPLSGITDAFAQTGESPVIRLTPSETDGSESGPNGESTAIPSDGRRSFDYEAFGARLDGYWFQRKFNLKEGDDDDASRQADNIRAFVAEEGIRRLDVPAGALIAEASRYLREGNHSRAMAALALAESLDPGRPQIRFVRAAVLRDSGAGIVASVAEFARACRGTLGRLVSEPTVLHPALFAAIVGILATGFLYGLLMIVRYQVSLRHEVEEWMQRGGRETAAGAAGWAVVLLPFLVWFGVGWAALYWTMVTFRFMRSRERVTAILLLVSTALCVPAYRLAVGLQGLSADPRTRIMLEAASGAYEPERVVKLRQWAESEPDDPTHHFLLAGLYKGGRYFEEAFETYKRVLELAPSTYQADINLGNIFFQMGQYGEAIAQYRRAIEKRPDSVLAYCNLYLAQTETFKLTEAAETLETARSIDADEVARLLSGEIRKGGRPMVVDATVDVGAIWRAALGGKRLKDWLGGVPRGPGWGSLLLQLLNPLSVAAIAASAGCGLIAAATHGRPPARRCIRCGRPFCSACKSSREGHEYCSQCLHLFVLQDGLAPETKSRKMYEIEIRDRRARRMARLGSLLLPGSGGVLKGHPGGGVTLMAAWLVAGVALRPETAWPIERILGLDLRLDALTSGPVPCTFDPSPIALIALPLLFAVWLIANIGVGRLREV